MGKYEKTETADQDQALYELLGVLREQGPAGRWTSAGQRKAWRPPTDVYETADCYVVKVEIAGMQHADLHIALEAKHLTVSGIRQDSSAKVGYQQMEIQYGTFESHISLPGAVDQDGVEASYQEGFLTIRLPKAQARRVKVTHT
jgi:HSP20 family protein